MKKILLRAVAFAFFIQPVTSYAAFGSGSGLPPCTCNSPNVQITCDEGKTPYKCKSSCDCSLGSACLNGKCVNTPSFPTFLHLQNKNKDPH